MDVPTIRSALVRLRSTLLLVPLVLAVSAGSHDLWPRVAFAVRPRADGALVGVGGGLLWVVGLVYLGRVSSREGWWPGLPIAAALATPLHGAFGGLVRTIGLPGLPPTLVLTVLFPGLLRSALLAGVAGLVCGAVGAFLDRRVLPVPRQRPLPLAGAGAAAVILIWGVVLVAERPPGPDTYVPPPEDAAAVREVLADIVQIQRGWIGSRGYPGAEATAFVDREGRTEVEVWLLPGSGWAARVGRKGLRPWGCIHWDSELPSGDPAIAPPETPRGNFGPKRVTVCDPGG